MTEELKISSESSKEDVANFFVTKFNIKEQEKNNIIKEDISGDVLKDLDDNDFKSLKIKLGPLKKIKTFIKENLDKFGEKQINEKITIKSSPKEVADFFENCLNFKGELNNLDGKGLIELNEEGIKNIGLNIGQKKKIVKYINYFKTLKIEEPEETEIILRRNSSEEEVSKYLKEKLKNRTSGIEALGLDGESLFALEENDIDGEDDFNQEEKDSLKQYLKVFKDQNGQTKEEEAEIVITKKSTEEDVSNYLKKKLKINEKGIESLSLDGSSILFLEENYIAEEEN